MATRTHLSSAAEVIAVQGDGMGAYAWLTAIHALKGPGPWVAWLLAVLASEVGIHWGVLASGAPAAEVEALLLSTCASAGALLALWVVVRALEADAFSGFVTPADGTRAGLWPRLGGRWVGAVAAGAGIGILALWTGTAMGASRLPDLSVYCAIIVSVASLGSWGLLLGCHGGGGLAVLAGVGLWVLGHLPWGSPSLVPGPGGTWLQSLLPSIPTADLRAIGQRALGAVAVLVVAIALPRRGALARG